MGQTRNREVGSRFSLPRVKLTSGRIIAGGFEVRKATDGCDGCCFFIQKNRYSDRKCALSVRERTAYVGRCKAEHGRSTDIIIKIK